MIIARYKIFQNLIKHSMGLPSNVLSQMISELKSKIAIVSNIVITINYCTDQNIILFITIRIILQRLSNSQT